VDRTHHPDTRRALEALRRAAEGPDMPDPEGDPDRWSGPHGIEHALLTLPTAQNRPVADPVAVLHRHRDFIATAFRDTGRWVQGPGVRADQLGFEWDRAWRDRDDFDRFLSINAYAGLSRGPGSPAERRSDNVTRLCAAAVDLDVMQLRERTGLPIGGAQVAGAALDRARAGLIPEPSMVLDSGRGAWLLWLLSDAEGMAELCTHENRLKYRATVQRLALSLEDLGADLAALDEARMIRAPGSINRKAAEDDGFEDGRVRWMPVLGRRSSPVWSLADLASAAGVGVGEIEAERHRAEVLIAKAHGASFDERKPESERDATAQAKALRRWEILAHRIEALGALRGGFAKGHRTTAATALAVGLTRSRHEGAEVEARCQRLGDRCHPPLTASEVRSAIAARVKYVAAGIRNQRWADRLDITPSEAEQLTVDHSSQATPFPSAARFRASAPEQPKRLGRKQARELRIEWLRARFPGGVCREGLALLSTALLEETGLCAAPKTLGDDLDRAGIARAAHGRRPESVELPFE
jgi:hypothetical protein